MNTAYDVLIIGAGPSGLCAAKTVVQCEPNINIGLIDSVDHIVPDPCSVFLTDFLPSQKASVGGVWSSESLYEGLVTNNLWGTLDFNDMRMDPDTFGAKPGNPITGEQMHQYLLAYAKKWDLLRLTRFNTAVSSVEKGEGDIGWKVTVRATHTASTSTLTCKKLIVCTGLTNAPQKPVIPGDSDFEGPIIHSAELGREQARVIKDPGIRTVTVLGGGKSAYDAVYLAAMSGKTVEWCIRGIGKGPAWVFPSHAKIGPFMAWREKLIMRRFLTMFSPCIWGAYDGFGWLRSFFHSTWLGTAISKAFWQDIHSVTLKDCRYREDQKLYVLEPEQSPFFYGTASGVYSYEKDLYSFVKLNQIRIHRDDITHLSSHTIHLASGKDLVTDALITATGYTVRPTLQFNPPTLSADLGLPTPTTALTPAQTSLWASLNLAADQEITSVYPRLTAGPFYSPKSNVPRPYILPSTPNSDVHYTPYRLYRSIAPPLPTADHSIAFVGYVSNIANTTRLEIQCLWAYAYLTRQLSVPPHPDTVYAETALMSRFCHFRAPYGHGRWYPDLNFDQLPFFDMLLTDLGLRVWRKGNVLRELFEAYGWEDYRGLVGEWLEGRRRGGQDVKTISGKG